MLGFRSLMFGKIENQTERKLENEMGAAEEVEILISLGT